MKSICDCANGDEQCPKCCDHGDICQDERICLDCGKDMTEKLISDAYDRAKDREY